jgi:hypothetical protein
MTDPRYTDPRYNDPPVDTGLRRDRSGASMWGWIAGLAVVVLIAFILVAGWNGSNRTVENGPHSTVGSGTTAQPVPPPTTTGQGGATMAPSVPATSPAGAK